MKKRWMLLLCLFVCLLGVSVPVLAEQEPSVPPIEIDDVVQELGRELGAHGLQDALPHQAGDLLWGVSPTDVGDWQGSLNRMAGQAGQEAMGYIRNALRTLLLIMGILLLCGVVRQLRPTEGDGIDVVTMAGALAIGMTALGEVNGLLEMGRQTLESMKTFADLLLPVMAAAAAAGGHPAAGLAKQAAAVLFSDLLMTVVVGVCVPMLYGFLALSVANAAIGHDLLGKIAEFLRWLATRLLVLLMTAYVIYITVSGVLSGAADAVAVKTVKAAVGFVPVVGGIIADAADAVMAGASILQASVGVFGMLAILAVALTPFLRLGTAYLLYKVGTGVAGVVAEPRLNKLLGDIGSAFGLILGMVGAGVFLLMVALLSSVRMVSG